MNLAQRKCSAPIHTFDNYARHLIPCIWTETVSKVNLVHGDKAVSPISFKHYITKPVSDSDDVDIFKGQAEVTSFPMLML